MGKASARAAMVVRTVWGVVLIAFPGLLLDRVSGAPSTRPGRVVARVLGLRHLVQAMSLGSRPCPNLRRIGAMVDGIHAVSAVGWAALDDRYRRVALIDALIAGGWGLVELQPLVGSAGSRPWLIRVDRTRFRNPAQTTRAKS
jgi:hypothetical protein